MNKINQLIADYIQEHERKFHRKKSKNKPYSESFLLFWRAFKGRWNADKSRFDKGGKEEAFIEWELLTLDQRKRAVKVAGKTGDKLTKDACRWLKYKRWEDFETEVNPVVVKVKEEIKECSPERKKEFKAIFDNTFKKTINAIPKPRTESEMQDHKQKLINDVLKE